MRLIVASTFAPFIQGGDRRIVHSLVDALKERGHEVETVLIPMRTHWKELPPQTIALRLLDLTSFGDKSIDRLITIRYPSYALQHPNKVSWFIHHHRGAYDLWGTEFQDLPNSVEGRRAREALIQSDTRYLRECRRIFTNSHRVADRLRVGNNLVADGVLFPPHPYADLFSPGDYGPYLVYSARLAGIKRQHLAIEALKYTSSSVRLVFIGSGDIPSYIDELRQLARAHGVEGKVEFRGWVDESEKARITAGALACLYIAFDEDSYGYSTLEAFHCAKAVLTCDDSGGTGEVIEHERNGLVVAPTPEAVGMAMERLWNSRAETMHMGREAAATIANHGIGWDNVVGSLLA